MEFHEKLQELRKSRGLTQEELAEALYVSRTAVSKWESGRGYPNIDSLKEIAKFFSVSIDELLSGEKILSIAEKENQSNIRRMCDLLFGMADICFLALIFLPLYPKTMEGYIYSVNLFSYTEIALLNRCLYWGMFIVLIVLGGIKIIVTQFIPEKNSRILSCISIIVTIFLVLILAVTREAYAIVAAFLLLVIKGMLLLKSMKTGFGSEGM